MNTTLNISIKKIIRCLFSRVLKSASWNVTSDFDKQRYLYVKKAFYLNKLDIFICLSLCQITILGVKIASVTRA